MSSYYGSELIFDGISSLQFDMRISNFESGGTSSGDAGSEAKLVQAYIYRRTSPYYYGRLLHSPLELEITLSNFDSKFTTYDRNVIESWLLGRSGYKPLMIVQDDMEQVVFNAYIDKASIKYVGNIARGITLNVKCREPWAYTAEKALTKNYVSSANEIFSFYNDSAEDDYLYPIITFTNSGIPNSFTLYNATDSITNSMSFTNLTGAGVVYTVDCSRQIISASNGDNIMSKFNKKFFRLVPKMNVINLVGDITQFTMTYKFARKIGG
jgi:hypothetical protein